MKLTNAHALAINYILCAERTGSTLLTAMLNMHPNIVSPMEQPFSLLLYPKYRRISHWTSDTIVGYCDDFYAVSTPWLQVQFTDQATLRELLESHLEGLTIDIAIRLTYLCFFPDKPKAQVTTVIDKQIDIAGQAMRLASIYPQSKFIVLYRDPRDNALVRFRKAKKQNWDIDYGYISLSWNSIYTLLHRYKGLLGKDRVLEVKYEDLMANPEAELRCVCAFLGLPYDDAMLRYDEYLKQAIPKAMGHSDAQLQKDLYLAEGLTQKPHTDKVGLWKAQLPPADANLIWRICGELATTIGYVKDGCDGMENSIKVASYAKFLLNYMLFEKLYFWMPFALKKPFKRLMAAIF
jgi:hypothetical protein